MTEMNVFGPKELSIYFGAKDIIQLDLIQASSDTSLCCNFGKLVHVYLGDY